MPRAQAEAVEEERRLALAYVDNSKLDLRRSQLQGVDSRRQRPLAEEPSLGVRILTTD
jgi:hypothetical protein